jgi:prepilin-type N-terminal cleavage/methylation domain-containing protein
MHSRLRSEDGFGLVELLAAMAILSIGLLALLSAIVSGETTLRRASRTATAATLADAQMELYRALTYGAIALDATQVGLTDSTYRGDTALAGDIANDITTTTGCSGLPNQCNPSRTLTGPDHGSYRVDTYVLSRATPSGRPVKVVTVVVRDGDNPAATYVRQSSSFDLATGS